MARWITLRTFQHSAQAHLVRTRLESEGLQVFIKHEHLAQLAPHHLEPGGPLKLQVQEHDVDAALRILEKGGYLEEEKGGFRKSALIKGVDMMTSGIPGLKNKPLQLRLIFTMAVLLVAITLVVAWLTLPSSL